MLEVCNVDTLYGKVQALWDICLEVNKSEIVALIGSNGSGKTTLVNTISGLIRPASGSVVFQGERIDSLPSHSIVELGISYVPQGGRIFREMNVRENLEMGSYPKRAWEQRDKTFEYVFELFPRLKERENQLARTLSGGEHQMLAIGRALMSKPTLCIFDEPSYGLAPKLVTEVFQTIQNLKEEGITILLIEQNVRLSLEIADRAYVLENGRLCLQGDCEELLESDHVKKAYLGL
ncbi:MAG: ABC transporter ATP-binding protein [Anaerolineales bacterium]|jgi:branched-chain amino acid transport system ATP-binding protein